MRFFQIALHTNHLTFEELVRVRVSELYENVLQIYQTLRSRKEWPLGFRSDLAGSSAYGALRLPGIAAGVHLYRDEANLPDEELLRILNRHFTLLQDWMLLHLSGLPADRSDIAEIHFNVYNPMTAAGRFPYISYITLDGETFPKLSVDTLYAIMVNQPRAHEGADLTEVIKKLE